MGLKSRWAGWGTGRRVLVIVVGSIVLSFLCLIVTAIVLASGTRSVKIAQHITELDSSGVDYYTLDKISRSLRGDEWKAAMRPSLGRRISWTGYLTEAKSDGHTSVAMHLPDEPGSSRVEFVVPEAANTACMLRREITFEGNIATLQATFGSQLEVELENAIILDCVAAPVTPTATPTATEPSTSTPTVTTAPTRTHAQSLTPTHEPTATPQPTRTLAPTSTSAAPPTSTQTPEHMPTRTGEPTVQQPTATEATVATVSVVVTPGMELALGREFSLDAHYEYTDSVGSEPRQYAIGVLRNESSRTLSSAAVTGKFYKGSTIVEENQAIVATLASKIEPGEWVVFQLSMAKTEWDSWTLSVTEGLFYLFEGYDDLVIVNDRLEGGGVVRGEIRNDDNESHSPWVIAAGYDASGALVAVAESMPEASELAPGEGTLFTVDPLWDWEGYEDRIASYRVRVVAWD